MSESSKYEMLQIDLSKTAYIQAEWFGEQTVSLEIEDEFGFNPQRITGYLNRSEIEKLRDFLNRVLE